MKSIDHLNKGFVGIIQQVKNSETFNKYLLELGFTPGEKIEIICKAPFGGPISLGLRGTTIALRRNEAIYILC